MTLPTAALQLLYGQVGGQGQYQTLAGFLYGVDSATVNPQNLDVDRVNALIEQALADTTGFRQAATAIANGTLSRVDDVQIALHTEQAARGYAIDGGVLTAPINADLHLGYQIEMNERAGDNISNVFLPNKTYIGFRNGLLTPTPITVQGVTFHVDYRYQHNATSGHDEIELRCQQDAGRPTDLTTFYDFEVYELNVAVVETQPGQTEAQVQTAIRNALIDYVRSGDFNIRRATVDSRITNLDNSKVGNETYSRAISSIIQRTGVAEMDIDAVETVLPTKADRQPVHIDLDRYHVQRASTQAFSFEMVLRQINPSLLPGVTNIRVDIAALSVHTQMFNPATDTEQVFLIEVGGVEINNLVRNIRGRNAVPFDVYFRDGNNQTVHHEVIPMAVI